MPGASVASWHRIVPACEAATGQSMCDANAFSGKLVAEGRITGYAWYLSAGTPRFRAGRRQQSPRPGIWSTDCQAGSEAAQAAPGSGHSAWCRGLPAGHLTGPLKPLHSPPDGRSSRYQKGADHETRFRTATQKGRPPDRRCSLRGCPGRDRVRRGHLACERRPARSGPQHMPARFHGIHSRSGLGAGPRQRRTRGSRDVVQDRFLARRQHERRRLRVPAERQRREGARSAFVVRQLGRQQRLRPGSAVITSKPRLRSASPGGGHAGWNLPGPSPGTKVARRPAGTPPLDR